LGVLDRFQVTVAILLLTVFSSKAVQKAVKEVITLIAPVDISEFNPSPQKIQGGRDRSLLPAPKGKLPRPSLRQFTPPVVVPQNQQPKLAMDHRPAGYSPAQRESAQLRRSSR
jgi:hypothetical protein